MRENVARPERSQDHTPAAPEPVWKGAPQRKNTTGQEKDWIEKARKNPVNDVEYIIG